MYGKKKIKKSDYYGEYVFSEFAGLDFIHIAKVESNYFKETGRELGWTQKYHPISYFPAISFPPDKSFDDEDAIKELKCVVFSSVFASENKDWFHNNKDFIEKSPEKDYFKKMKYLPIGMDDDTFQIWFANSARFMNEVWQENNPEFMNFWNKKVLENNESFVLGCKNGDMKTVRKAIKMGADVNFQFSSGLAYAVKNDDLALSKYLINKRAEVYQSFLVDVKSDAMNLLITDTLNKQNEFWEKRKKFKY